MEYNHTNEENIKLYNEEYEELLSEYEDSINNENRYEYILLLIIALIREKEKVSLIDESVYKDKNIIKYMTNVSEPYYIEEHIFDIINDVKIFIKESNKNYSIASWKTGEFTIYLNPDMRYDFDYKVMFETKTEEESLFKLALYIQIEKSITEELNKKYKMGN
jgi:hypothetical protein